MMSSSCTIELMPTENQKITLERTFYACRLAYNLYLKYSIEAYESERRITSVDAFCIWLNRRCADAPINSIYYVILQTSQQAVKNSIYSASRAFRNYANGIADKPKFKDLSHGKVHIYFSVDMNYPNIICEGGRIVVPYIDEIYFRDIYNFSTVENIKNGCISCKNARYYVTYNIGV